MKKHVLSIALGFLLAAGIAHAQEASRVTFPSADGKTTLVGYLFEPRTANGAAIVLLHGRAGAYSIDANGVYTAETLTRRHKAWASRFAVDGYVVLLVDSFGPRGYPQGFGKGSYDERPDAVSEVTVRPLDAYGALRFLRKQRNVDPARVGLMGWSNGGSTALVAMASGFTPVPESHAGNGFRAAVALYPGCGLQHSFDFGYRPYAPVRVFSGTNDDEVSPHLCEELARKSRQQGADVAITFYPGATHDFDDPGDKRQSVPANVAAADSTVSAVQAFFANKLLGR